MGVESASDILDFFKVDDFATVATYVSAVSGTSQVKGIFDAPQASRNATNLLDVTMPAPQFVCPTGEVPNAAEGDGVTIANIAYTVRVVLHDGTGVSTLILERN